LKILAIRAPDARQTDSQSEAGAEPNQARQGCAQILVGWARFPINNSTDSS
jgi:hypothetical protein